MCIPLACHGCVLTYASIVSYPEVCGLFYKLHGPAIGLGIIVVNVMPYIPSRS